MTSTELKSLQVRIRAEEAKLVSLAEQQSTIQKEMNHHRNTIAILRKQMATAANKTLVVSEHARLRYLERVSGIPMETVDEQILSAFTSDQIPPNGSYPLAAGGRIVIRGGIVVTVES